MAIDYNAYTITQALQSIAADTSGLTATQAAQVIAGAVDAQGILPNYGAVVAPGTGDDETAGYAIGSVWVDTVTDLAYICVDASTGAAVWKDITAGGGGGSGDVVGPASATDGAVALYDGTTGKLVKDSKITVSGDDVTVTDGSFTVDGDAYVDGGLLRVSTPDANHTYVDINSVSGKLGEFRFLNAGGGVWFCGKDANNDFEIRDVNGAVPFKLGGTDETATFTGDVTTGGGRVRSVTSVSATHTAAAGEDIIIATANTFTVTLPAIGQTGRTFTIKNAGSGTVTVDGDGAETIDGAATQALAQYDSITVVDNSSDWSLL